MIAIMCGLLRSSMPGSGSLCPGRWRAAGFAAVLGLAPGSGWADPPQPLEMYRVAIMLTSQQASGDLSQALLAMTANTDGPASRMDPIAVALASANLREEAEEQRKKENKERDRYHLNQGVFALDLARALKVWPTPNADYEIGILPSPELLRRFGDRTFPDVVVTSFPFRLVLPRETALTVKPALAAKDGERLEGETKEIFCRPDHTLIVRSKCQVRVVRPAFREEPLIEVVQIGFRIETRKAMPLAQSTALINEVRDAVKKARKTELPAKDLTAIQIPEYGWRGRNQEQQQAAKSSLAEVTADGIEKLWKRVNGSVQDVAHPANRPHWPSIEIFDSSVPRDSAHLYDDWLKKLMAAKIGTSGPDCVLDPELPSHSDAVTSLLFPALVKGRLASQGQALASQGQALPSQDQVLAEPPLDLPGAIQGVSRLLDPQKKEFANYEDGRQPVVGLAVYTGVSQGDGENSDAVRLHNILTSDDVRRILVVSAAAKKAVPAGYSKEFPLTPSNEQDAGRAAVVAACSNGPFPSCLGQNPRVLVVAPLEEREKYVVGASMVGIAAPGGSVPVVHGCGGNDPASPKWGKAHSNGSSFAAPLVAAVIAKIMGVAAPDQPSARDPYVAMLRILATADPLNDGKPTDVTYGKLNVSRALTGADHVADTANKRATLYNTNGSIEHVVVSAYPWAHDLENMELFPKSKTGTAKDLRLWHRKRGVIRLTIGDRPPKPLDLRHLVRIVPDPATAKDANPRFDVYYLNLRENIPSAQLVTARNARIGVMGVDPGTQGYCSERGASPSYHACLYKWNGDPGSGFEPIDLTTVKDIVFSPNHHAARSVSGFDPVEFVLDLSPPQTSQHRTASSPWRSAFCKTGVPRPVLDEIVARTNRPQLQAGDLHKAYSKYCAS